MEGRPKAPPPVPRKKHKLEPVSAADHPQEYAPSDSVYHVPKEQLLACDDLLRLPILYDDIVLQCMHTRYKGGQYYTWAGPTLVAVNPCHPVDYLYTTGQIEHHHQQVKIGTESHTPHVYSVAGVAHHRLQHDIGLLNQAILVSGESGSGKTESARYMLGYLINVEKKYSQNHRTPLKDILRDKHPEDIQKNILASNPVLEAFGNAATLRNHNSSRFGKLIRLQYGGERLHGAEIDTYLLEKTRVTHQPHKERNFHIFYQVVSGIREGIIKGLEVEEDQKFGILTLETATSDISNLKETLRAFKQLQFSTSHLEEIYKVILALLYLGNIQFKQGEGGDASWTISKENKDSSEGLRNACTLLGLNEDSLLRTLTVHTINVCSAGKVSVFHKPLERESQCAERRDALMQLIYQTLFLHIVSFINNKISTHRNMWSHFMGILDIYGFETFEKNSLEQLCINYANERLQQAFILRYLAAEHEILKEEGFLEMDIPYTDNSNCVMVLDSSVSVFAVLNEECQLKRDVKEEEACNRICNALAYTGVVSAPPFQKPIPGFVIRHYAGPVQYAACGLLHKNKDEVPHEVLELLAATHNTFIDKLLSLLDNTDPDSGRRTTRKITTLAKFKSSLDSLMKTLSVCDLHYVRCIKPSIRGLAGQVDENYLMQQLRACGVIETVCISQAGYPVRITYKDFIKRYGDRQRVSDVVAASINVTKSVLSSTEENTDSLCRFGRTRIFLSECALHALEKVRHEKRTQAATCLQKCWKGYQSFKQFRQLKQLSLVVQRNIRRWLAENKYKKLKRACVVIQKNVRRFIIYQKYQRICKATLVIQSYFRGWMARKGCEVLRQQAGTRPYSSQSFISMSSLGYSSLTTSVSSYSCHPSLLDASPSEIRFGHPGVMSLSGDMLNFYVSPQHQQRLLETEESGIETDTESINGDSGTCRPRKFRRRARLQNLQTRPSVQHAASDESLECSPDKATTTSGAKAKENGISSVKTDSDKQKGNGEGRRACNISKGSPCKRPCTDDTKRKRKPLPLDAQQKMRIATLKSLHEITGVVKSCSPSEDLQLVLLKQSLSLFFKGGVLSYRRMPVVAIKFHTRPTCLPFSYHLPYHEQPQGLWEALH